MSFTKDIKDGLIVEVTNEDEVEEKDELTVEEKFNDVGEDGDLHQPGEGVEVIGEISDQPTHCHESEMLVASENHI